MNTEVGGGPRGGGQVGGGDVWGHEEQGAVWTVSVRRIHSECWPDTGERLEPIVVYRCGETDKQKDLYKRHTPETILLRCWPGSSSGRGSNSPRTADRVEIYVQQTWTESMFGEDGDNWDIRGKSCKCIRVGRSLNKEKNIIPGWSDMWSSSSPISKMKNLWGVAWTLAWVFS